MPTPLRRRLAAQRRAGVWGRGAEAPLALGPLGYYGAVVGTSHHRPSGSRESSADAVLGSYGTGTQFPRNPHAEDVLVECVTLVGYTSDPQAEEHKVVFDDKSSEGIEGKTDLIGMLVVSHSTYAHQPTLQVCMRYRNPHRHFAQRRTCQHSSRLDVLTDTMQKELEKQGFAPTHIRTERMLSMRFNGTDTARLLFRKRNVTIHSTCFVSYVLLWASIPFYSSDRVQAV